MGRLADRRGEAVENRVSWAENDLDSHEKEIARVTADFKGAMESFRLENREQHAEVKKRIDGMQRVMISILVTMIGLLGAFVLNLLGSVR